MKTTPVEEQENKMLQSPSLSLSLSLILFDSSNHLHLSLPLSSLTPCFSLLHNHTAYHCCGGNCFNFWFSICLLGGKQHEFHTKVCVLKLPLLSNLLDLLRRFSQIPPQQEQTFGLICGSRLSTLCLSLQPAVSFQCHTHLEEKPDTVLPWKWTRHGGKLLV